MFRTITSTLLASTIAVASLLASPSPSVAAVETANVPEAKRAINIAGRQRMLTQRMAKAACLMQVMDEADSHRAVFKDASELFRRSLAGLREGNAEMGLSAMTGAEVTMALEAVEDYWVHLDAVSARIADGEGSDADFEAISRRNVRLLQLSDALVGALEAQHGGAGVNPLVAATINVAGRQRMLSQRMGKAACEMVRQNGAESARAELYGAVDDFAAGINALTAGDPETGVMMIYLPDIVVQLFDVYSVWCDMQKRVGDVARGLDTPTATLALLSQTSDLLLVEADRAVQLYEAL